MKKLLSVSLSLAIAASVCAADAHACMPVPIVPPPPVVPLPSSGIDGAVVARPVRLTVLERLGRPYWRAVYEVVSTHRGIVEPQHVIVEWTCDPPGSDSADACAERAPAVLPGFDDSGRSTGGLFELDLSRHFASSLDGVPVYGANGGAHAVTPAAGIIGFWG